MKSIFQILIFGYLPILVFCKEVNLTEFCTKEVDSNRHSYDVLCTNLNLSDCDDNTQFHYSIREISSLTFRNCSIRCFPDKLLQIFNSNSRFRLDLSGNEVKSIHITRSGRISHLNLSHNSIPEITDGMFNSYIGVLDLSHNLIENIEPNAFKEIENIQILNLSNNALTELKEFTFTMPKFWSNPDLLLDLSNNLIRSIEKNCFQNSALAIINLQKNRLQIITPEMFQGATDLESLNLMDNFIERIEDNSFAEFIQLSEIFLGNNRLKVIQEFVFRKEIVGDFIKYPQRIDLSMNPLEKVYFHENSNIEFLNLSSGNLSSFEYDTFQGLYNLRTLVLSNNGIETFDTSILYPMRKLETLYLNDNKLKEIDYEDPRFNVPRIDLTYNQWNCSYLKKMIKHLNLRNVEYIISKKPNSKRNIAGIGCIEEEERDEVLENQNTIHELPTTVINYLKKILDKEEIQKVITEETNSSNSNFTFYNFFIFNVNSKRNIENEDKKKY